MKTQSDQSMVVLKSMLDDQASVQETKESSKPDLSTILAPLMESVQKNAQQLAEFMASQGQTTQATLAQIVEGMKALHRAHSAPRTAQYIRDPMGNVLGVKSTIEGQDQHHVVPLPH